MSQLNQMHPDAPEEFFKLILCKWRLAKWKHLRKVFVGRTTFKHVGEYHGEFKRKN